LEQYQFHLTVTDRQGQLRSRTHDFKRHFEVLALLRTILGLCFADKPVLGYDLTMTTVNDQVQSIMLMESNSMSSIRSSQNSVFSAEQHVWTMRRVLHS
jgi:hypothetical protein